MILEELKIESFRGMAEVSLQGLPPVSLVVGANNAGKSSVLEAAALLLRPYDPAQWVQVARQRDLDMALVEGLWSLFPSRTPMQVDDGPKQTEPLRVAGLVNSSSRALAATGLASLNWDSEESGDLVLRVEARVNEGGSPQDPHEMVFRREVPAQYGKGITLYRSFTVTSATHRSTHQLVEHLSKAVDAGKKNLAVELLSLFDPEIQGLDISSSGGRDGVRVTHATRGVVDLASFGDGMRRAAALALALVRAQGGLLLADEIEAGIHQRILPEVLSRLIQAAEAAEVQILATTHSLEAIDALITAVNGLPERSAVYYLQRRTDRHLVRRYGQDEFTALRETGLDLR